MIPHAIGMLFSTRINYYVVFFINPPILCPSGFTNSQNIISIITLSNLPACKRVFTFLVPIFRSVLLVSKKLFSDVNQVDLGLHRHSDFHQSFGPQDPSSLSVIIYSSGFQPFWWRGTPMKHTRGSRNPCAII